MQGLRHRSHYIAQLNESLIGKSVTVAGWIEDVRDIGRLVFVVIRDTTGTVQTIARGENVSIAKDIPRQSSVIVSGTLRKVTLEITLSKLAFKTSRFFQGQYILYLSMLRGEWAHLLTNVLILEHWI